MVVRVLLIMLLCVSTALAADKPYFSFPDMLSPTATDSDRILVYDVETNSSKDITLGTMKSVFGSPDWANIANKPATFTPATHNHLYSDISNPPTIPSTATQISYANPTYTTVASALDQLLYVAPGSPSVSGGGSYEYGQTITSVALTWTITLGTKSLTTQSIDNGIGSISTALRAYTHSSQTITAYRSYIVSITDGTTPRTGSTALTFYWKRYWGATATPLASLTSANINALAGSEFSATHTKSGVVYDCTGGKYPTFAYPTAWGLLTAVKVGGLSFTDYSYRTISHTNASGGVANYYLYQFNGIQSGSAISVDWD